MLNKIVMQKDAQLRKQLKSILFWKLIATFIVIPTHFVVFCLIVTDWKSGKALNALITGQGLETGNLPTFSAATSIHVLRSKILWRNVVLDPPPPPPPPPAPTTICTHL